MIVRYQTLYDLGKVYQWGFVPTNWSKAHLLQLRKERYVNFANWDHKEVLKNGTYAYGQEKLGYYYCLTLKGVNKLSELFPGDEMISKLRADFFDNIFVEYDASWIDFRR